MDQNIKVVAADATALVRGGLHLAASLLTIPGYVAGYYAGRLVERAARVRR